MQTSNTALFFLEDDCIRAFGQETGCTLLQQAEELYQDLCQHGNDRGNHVIEEHLQSRLFPLMSYYKALLKHGIRCVECHANSHPQPSKCARFRVSFFFLWA